MTSPFSVTMDYIYGQRRNILDLAPGAEKFVFSVIEVMTEGQPNLVCQIGFTYKTKQYQVEGEFPVHMVRKLLHQVIADHPELAVLYRGPCTTSFSSDREATS